MMKRFCILFTAILTALVFFSVGTLMAGEQTVPDKVKIENKGYKKDKKGPVELDHKKHAVDYKIACADCHHKYEKDKNVWKGDAAKFDHVDKCSKCHDLNENTEQDGMKVMKLQNAYHKNCKTCHKEKGKGPFKKCNDCHAKK